MESITHRELQEKLLESPVLLVAKDEKTGTKEILLLSLEGNTYVAMIEGRLGQMSFEELEKGLPYYTALQNNLQTTDPIS